MQRTKTKAIEHEATPVDAMRPESLRPDRPCVGRALTEPLDRKSTVDSLSCHRWPCASGAMTKQLVRKSPTNTVSKTASPPPPQSGGGGEAGVGWFVPGFASRESCGEQQHRTHASALAASNQLRTRSDRAPFAFTVASPSPWLGDVMVKEEGAAPFAEPELSCLSPVCRSQFPLLPRNIHVTVR